MQHNMKMSLKLLAAVLLITACSKHEDTPPVPPGPTPAKAEPPQSAAPVVTSGAKPTTIAADNQAAMAKSSNPSQVAAVLETAYISNPEFSARVDTIYKLTDAGTPEAIASLGRLFQMEKDVELKTEILDSLFDIDGHDDKKIALLSAGAGADQPKEVRESAIDALGDLDAKYALPVLQSLTGDPDEEIRDAAKDAIEMLTPPK